MKCKSVWSVALLAMTLPSTVAFTPLSLARTSTPMHAPHKHRPTRFGKESSTRLYLTPPPPSSLLTSLTSPLGALSVLAGVVLFHEAGHYLAARVFGITVEEFSVGVGPKLTGFVSNKEEFNLRALPLGGYVKFPENYNVTLARREQEEFDKAKRLAKDKAKQKKQQKQVDGSLDRLFKMSSLFGNNKKKLAEKPQTTQKQPWKNLFQSKSKKRLDETPRIDYYKDPDLLQNRPWAQRAVVLSGGIVFNLLLAFLLFFGEITIGNGLPHPVLERGAIVASMRPNSASQGVLQPGDLIVGINGVPVAQSTTLGSSQRAISNLIADIRATPTGDSVALEIKRPTLPSDVLKVVVQPKPMTDNDGPQSLGVMLAPNYVRTDLIRTRSIPDATVYAGRAVVDVTSETVHSLSSVLSQLVSNKGGAGQVSGPIGLIRTGSEVVSRNDASAIVVFAAAVSVNLAVINALPLPALDGGQLVFVLAEALTRRKVDQQLQERITAYTLLFLLLVSVGTAVGDVESIFAR